MNRFATGLAFVILMACGDDGPDDRPLGPLADMAIPEVDGGAALDGGSDTDFLSQARAVWAEGCECLDAGAARTACLDDADKISAQVAAQGGCVVTPFDDPGAADYVACYQSTTDTLESCLEAGACDTDAVAACYDAWDPAIEGCPQPPDAVWEAVEACFG